MEIKSIKVSRLRNEEHFQFQTGFYNLINKHKSEALGVKKLFTEYKVQYAIEQGALDKIQKNSLTEDIAHADEKRDTIYTGLKEAVSSGSKHFTTEIQEPAKRVLLVLEHYGNLTRKNYEAKTAAINDLILELTSNYTDEVKIIKIKEWIDQLKRENVNFQALQDERDTIEAQSSHVPMSDTRVAIDIRYKNIIKMINALILVNGEGNYAIFSNELNEKIDRFNMIISRRGGKGDVDVDFEVEPVLINES